MSDFDIPSGARPFERRARRPLNGPPFSPAQTRILNEREEDLRASILEEIRTGVRPSPKLPPVPPAPIRLVDTDEAEPGETYNVPPEAFKFDAPPTEGLTTARAGTDSDSEELASASGAPILVPAGTTTLEPAYTRETLPMATPGMIALINDAPAERRAELAALAAEDKPAQVRLAAIRKAAALTPTET